MVVVVWTTQVFASFQALRSLDQTLTISFLLKDFANFAAAPNPVAQAAAAANTPLGSLPQATGVPFTKWYNVHERHSISEFKTEGFILAATAFIFIFHFFGSKSNRSKAKAWIRANGDALKSEFSLVGFDRSPRQDADNLDNDSLLREKSLFEYSTYASGRQNIAFMDINITLAKRFNPLMNLAETLAGFVNESFGSPEDIVEAALYPFDGKESLTVPALKNVAEEDRVKDSKSTYDGFVWAIVNKSCMQKLRSERYDVSLTATKDHSKLPNWVTIMSESAEVTETLLTQELIQVVTAAGELFDYIVVTDQPLEQPTTLDETTPRKRMYLKYHLPTDNSYTGLVPLLSYFVRLPDLLVQSAHWRPEVLKKVRQVREAKIAQIKKSSEEEQAEDRAIEREKVKKAKRDAELKGLDAKAQKKYLEKEAAKNARKSQKKMTMRG